jgi:hypothetical protein
MLKKYKIPDISSGMVNRESIIITVPAARPIQNINDMIFLMTGSIIYETTISKRRNKNSTLDI